mgnify:CR=1 FL=1
MQYCACVPPYLALPYHLPALTQLVFTYLSLLVNKIAITHNNRKLLVLDNVHAASRSISATRGGTSLKSVLTGFVVNFLQLLDLT